MHIPRRFWQFKLRPNQKKTPLHSGAFLVPVTGLEPVRCRQRWILSPLRLPIPSHRHITICIIQECGKICKCFMKIFQKNIQTMLSGCIG